MTPGVSRELGRTERSDKEGNVLGQAVANSLRILIAGELGRSMVFSCRGLALLGRVEVQSLYNTQLGIHRDMKVVKTDAKINVQDL